MRSTFLRPFSALHAAGGSVSSDPIVSALNRRRRRLPRQIEQVDVHLIEQIGFGRLDSMAVLRDD